MIQLLNPFSYSLKKNPLMEIRNDKPIFIDGDFKAYKLCDKHIVHTFKNIVITERCALDKEVINNVKNDIKPKGETNSYFDYERAKAAIEQGKEIAKIINFQIK
jgi:hypothetical protein